MWAMLAPGLLAAAAGIGRAYWTYELQKGEPERAFAKGAPGLYRLVFDKWRIDELYDATVVGISHQDVGSHEAFTARHGLTVPLLADVDKAVARSYGVAAPVLGTRRAAFVVDEDGVVRYRHVHALGVDYQDADDLAQALAALPPAAAAQA